MLVVVGACSGANKPPARTDELVPRPTKNAILAGCSGGEDNEVRLSTVVEPDAPVLVLGEIHLHGTQPPQPTIAIWADGRVLFTRALPTSTDHVELESLEGSLPPAAVPGLVHDVAADLVAVPRYTDVFVHPGTSGGQMTTITVRDGHRWISATVYGAHEDDLLATAANPGVLPRAPRDLPPTLGFSIPTFETDPPPKPFARAYQRLLASRPPAGRPFVPHDFDLVVFSPGPSAAGIRSSEIAWPRELPAPPPDLALATCDDGDGCRYVLDARDREAAHRLDDALHATKTPPLLVSNGRRLSVRIDGLYRGERSIQALVSCSARLSNNPEL
ncbi:MAG: hypothetical protein IPQ07_42725 [Myxococcales bacterium]|nr:hypothetical protein [Myxococcales bacterium]